ncbi:hypothetical protein CWE09_03175 [Aliidiomarina minuta]|uniref:PTS EIIA type-1 domain-containing protein n=1 Tax=Aliidiomarina minuta TaxID=880057 RepID=A0A432W6Q2_9GAMM|nr:PTS glucose transporter subunit IIA [Aliidiomarina minuta]RUO25747.1 hypothetical protein CWE09_03175 [Aliidiomarina minuta]
MQLITQPPTDQQPMLRLMAPVSGHCSALQQLPHALFQILAFGQGFVMQPGTQRFLAPATCKIKQISADRTLWQLQLPNTINCRIELLMPRHLELPLAHSEASVGQLLQAGDPLFVLTAETMRNAPLIAITFTSKDPDISIQVHYGKVIAAQDTVLSFFNHFISE